MAITLISTVTVGAGGATTIDFTSIPQTYTDLMIVYSARNSSADNFGTITFNGSATGYSARLLNGNGASATSATQTSLIVVTSMNTDTANTFGNSCIYVPNYSGATNKSVSIDAVTENNGTTAQQRINAGLWSNTAAITQVTFTASTGTWVQYSTASIYGITKGSSGGVTVA